MTTEEVLELSVAETNKLRAELGLAPLRGTGAAPAPRHHDDPADNVAREPSAGGGDNGKQAQQAASQEEVLEMSVEDTNKLRATLGLPPLRDASSYRNIQDAGLVEKQRQEDEARFEAKEQLKEDVARGIKTTFTAQSLGEEASNDVSSWAAKLRQSSSSAAARTKKEDSKKKKKSKAKSKPGDDDNKYDEQDLKGMAVSHAASELEAGSTTVMTLADAPLLETDEHNHHIVTGLNDDANTPQLENVNLAEAAKQSDGLKKKRQLELGMGRAGGYAGFDDDEFEELGGTGAPSRMARGDSTASGGMARKGRRGFQIGDVGHEERGGNEGSDLFAMEAGNAISLEPMQADVQASDFMTEQEDLELRGKDKKKSKKKDTFEKKKKKKKDKKEKRKHRRRQQEEDEDESEDEGLPKVGSAGTKTLLQELEETAEENASDTKGRKRSRADDDADNGAEEAPSSVPSASILSKGGKKENKRAKYDIIMEKGNARTQQAFGEKQKSAVEDDILDEEPDDAFLNAALAKARRLKKLRGMNGGTSSTPAASGAAAVAAAVQAQPDAASSSSTANGGGITFSVDDTREFTRALQARSEQQSRKQTKLAAKKDTPSNTITTVKKVKGEPKVETVKQEDGGDEMDVDMNMEELAKEIKEDEPRTGSFLDGTTGNTVAVGRGLAGVLNLFQQTGELTRKNAGKEELRGRAKDERNYEAYEKVDLKSVVKIDDRYATEKDRELASREIKLEYRDKHGRLLTTKEAYRDLCYQFHGHGSSKKNEERRLKQMAREQAEGRLASQQLGGADGGPGMLGALKATQKASGKAFVIHKT